MSSNPLRIGAIVLTYNSTEDLPDCLSGLISQQGVDLRVIVVDNASRAEARMQMEADFQTVFPEGHVLPATADSTESLDAMHAIFLRNETNAGYSAGNNIGARLAAKMGCDAVLVINPDVRIKDPDYILTLATLITADPKTAVACSAMRNLSGAQENPMTEPGFIEELLWPVALIAAGLLRRDKPAKPLPILPCRVEKVSGACFMIRTDFLQRINFFDESVFLYCEESILMAQVQMADWHMMMEPRIEALHAHRISAKGDPLPRFDAWSKSRSRFHRVHGGYGVMKQALLAGSRIITLRVIWGRAFLGRICNGKIRTRIGHED